MNIEKAVADKVLFEEYVYEKKDDSFGAEYHGRNVWVEFGGGVFYYDYKEEEKDLNGFEINAVSIRKICTIECVRRSLLEKKKQGLGLSDLDKWEQNRLIAQVVYENAV